MTRLMHPDEIWDALGVVEEIGGMADGGGSCILCWSVEPTTIYNYCKKHDGFEMRFDNVLWGLHAAMPTDLMWELRGYQLAELYLLVGAFHDIGFQIEE